MKLELQTPYIGSLEDSYLARYGHCSQIESIADVLSLYEDLKNKFVDCTPLFIFEDIKQCEYTSFHREIADFSSEKIDDPTCKQQFLYTLEQLNKTKISFDEIYTETFFTENFFKLRDVNNNPIHLFKYGLDIKLCPTKKSTDTFAAMINGYFTGDFQPDENYTIIQKLYNNYNFDFIGIGSVFLFFKVAQPLSKELAKNLSDDLAKIYNFTSEQLQKMLDEHLTTKEYLFLPYAENFEDFISEDY
ncbi:hypothetical protein [Pasteurella sp. PK-2025]|uniref:hypothetical protein n=1 Tax=unclassified Pasteurella TaxID=2621516 RepID=UPI003C712580